LELDFFTQAKAAPEASILVTAQLSPAPQSWALAKSQAPPSEPEKTSEMGLQVAGIPCAWSSPRQIALAAHSGVVPPQLLPAAVGLAQVWAPVAPEQTRPPLQ
jgi:hypothetical protein